MKTPLESLLEDYTLKTKADYIHAIQEIIQEISLIGLWRAKFFEQAAFYGGTALRILYGLNRFSEDLDFSLLTPDFSFHLLPFLKGIEEELQTSGLSVQVKHQITKPNNPIRSAFLKAGTLETLIRIGLEEPLKRQIQHNENIKIKLEIDINPPPNFSTEIKYLIKPIPFSVRTYTLPDLFAGKMHAILCRPYQVRVKGRDWYDFIWYIVKKEPLHLAHLEARMRQSGHFLQKTPLTKEVFLVLLEEKISKLNVQAAQEDLWRFISDPKEVEGWSTEFFLSLLPLIKFS